jgi:hypothetical protein
VRTQTLAVSAILAQLHEIQADHYALSSIAFEFAERSLLLHSSGDGDVRESLELAGAYFLVT